MCINFNFRFLSVFVFCKQGNAKQRQHCNTFNKIIIFQIRQSYAEAGRDEKFPAFEVNFSHFVPRKTEKNGIGCATHLK